MAIKIARGSDPFKKYWWVVLLIFAIAGAWVCLPLLGGNTGSGSVAGGEAGLRPADQNLDALNGPGGAPGHVVDLSMDGSGPYKKASGPITDSLYQSAAESSARASAAVASAKASGGTLADALNDIARARSSSHVDGSQGSASAAIPAVPFNAAHASFGSMSGLGGSSSGSSASSSFGASSGGGVKSMNAFGTASPHVGVDYAQGLSAGKSQPAAAGAKSALQSASDSAFAAARSGNLDAAAGKLTRSFDGGGGGGLVGGPGASQGGVGINGDTVADLKPSANDYSKLNQRTITPPAVPMPPPNQPNMMQMLMMGLMAGLPGLLIGAL